MTAGAGLLPAAVGSDLIDCSARLIASPVAVPWPSCRLLIADTVSLRSVVGADTTEAVLAKEMTPTLMPEGSFAMKARAEALAASSRVGETSVASIDAEVSSVSITVARLRGVRLAMAGLRNR